MFLTHWLELSGVDRLMAPVSDGDCEASPHGPEEQESTELAFWSVVAPRRRPASAPGALQESGAGRNAGARKSSNGSSNGTGHNVSLLETTAMGNSASSNREGSTRAGLVECVHCHRLTPTADGPANRNNQPVPKTPGPSSTSHEPRVTEHSSAPSGEEEDDTKQQSVRPSSAGRSSRPRPGPPPRSPVPCSSTGRSPSSSPRCPSRPK